MKRNDNVLRSAADRGTAKPNPKFTPIPSTVDFAKCSASSLGNSFALVADGVESITDVLSGFVVYFGLKIARKPADADHPYGHGKAEPIAAVVVCLALMTGPEDSVDFEDGDAVLAIETRPSILRMRAS